MGTLPGLASCAPGLTEKGMRGGAEERGRAEKHKEWRHASTNKEACRREEGLKGELDRNVYTAAAATAHHKNNQSSPEQQQIIPYSVFTQ